MPQIDSNKRKPAIAVLLLIIVTLALAACGGSSSSSTSNAASTSTSTSAVRGAASGRFAALRECMQKNGITLPKPTPGQGRPPTGGGGFLGGRTGGGFKLPAGVTRAQYLAAIKKCGGGFGRGRAGGGQNFNSPAATAALAKFATCMRENGVKVPAPNTSGKGPVFNTNGLNTQSATFKAAETKCSATIRGLFRARPGGAGAPTGTPGSPPPAGE
jgi:hypothetical protein